MERSSKEIFFLEKFTVNSNWLSVKPVTGLQQISHFNLPILPNKAFLKLWLYRQGQMIEIKILWLTPVFSGK